MTFLGRNAHSVAARWDRTTCAAHTENCVVAYSTGSLSHNFQWLPASCFFRLHTITDERLCSYLEIWKFKPQFSMAAGFLFSSFQPHTITDEWLCSHLEHWKFATISNGCRLLVFVLSTSDGGLCGRLEHWKFKPQFSMVAGFFLSSFHQTSIYSTLCKPAY